MEPGIVLLDKPAGKTSFQALSPLKKQWGSTLGHTGTLDKFAEGLLVVLVGRFTRLTPFFTNFDKVYEADIHFGMETDTLDPEGAVVSENPIPSFETIRSFAPSFLGVQEQIPPEYSAIHVQGKRSYERVLAGETVQLTPRRIEIYQLEILNWEEPKLRVRIHCSKGTYIRSIARDWGRLAGCGAHVSALKRLTVGPFSLPLESPEFWGANRTLEFLKVPLFEVDQPERVLQGVPLENLRLELPDTERVSLWSGEKFLALCERGQNQGESSHPWRYIIVNN